MTARDDYAGLARVAARLATPIAGGEYVYGIAPFRHMLEARSVDIVMIDLVRVGGITQWMKVAGMAEAFNLPVVSHLIPEVHVHLIAAIPNGHIVEYMPWTARLFEDPPMPVKGQMSVPTAPGLGLKFTRDIRPASRAAPDNVLRRAARAPSPLGEKVPEGRRGGLHDATKEIAPHQLGQMTYARAIPVGVCMQLGARGRKSRPRVLSPKGERGTPTLAALPASSFALRKRRIRPFSPWGEGARRADEGAFTPERGRCRLCAARCASVAR